MTEDVFTTIRNAGRRIFSPDASARKKHDTEEIMTEVIWTTPEACEICVGMEVTSYMSAEI
ncbi:pyrroloquinoline quinone precursor peptide PqqA [Rhodoblastus sp.]|uniref:pyrroloquinoline quinone precursor peptide PqqA n=1 Tax=Rhodoblastus sp. TaxID=1962975 RepID=UPI0026092354|nr:pyrroloquinoline quinone precursor peptide PqqA [Rhodoblastus sp.]